MGVASTVSETMVPRTGGGSDSKATCGPGAKRPGVSFEARRHPRRGRRRACGQVRGTSSECCSFGNEMRVSW